MTDENQLLIEYIRRFVVDMREYESDAKLDLKKSTNTDERMYLDGRLFGLTIAIDRAFSLALSYGVTPEEMGLQRNK